MQAYYDLTRPTTTCRTCGRNAYFIPNAVDAEGNPQSRWQCSCGWKLPFEEAEEEERKRVVLTKREAEVRGGEAIPGVQEEMISPPLVSLDLESSLPMMTISLPLNHPVTNQLFGLLHAATRKAS